MKKLLCMILILITLSGCSPVQKNSTPDEVKSDKTYLIGVWLSYTELDRLLTNGDFKDNFATVLSNCKTKGITDIFVHTRAFCDSIYKSQIFPLRDSVKNYDFDVFEYMINECHTQNIKFHAWINPYRVKTSDSETDNLPDDSFVKTWLCDDDTANDNNICVYNGIYLNPASDEVRQTVTNGIREIIIQYDVDGIHFDDYFYPTQDETFDENSYGEYCSQTEKPLNLDEWRRTNVNMLISSVYTAIKFTNSDIIFSVSPSASIQDNYSKHYADISAWIDNSCVDYIIPQLYFGFEYPNNNFKFENLVKDWQNLTKKSETKLVIGLATYKINTENEPDRTEWANGTEVINRQIKICEKNEKIYGHIFFSYSSMCEYL